MRQNTRRADRRQPAVAPIGDLDIAAIRPISPEDSRVLAESLNAIETVMGGAFEPFAAKGLHIKVIGSSALKEVASMRVKHHVMVDQAELDAVTGAILDSEPVEALTLAVDPKTPMSLDEHDQLVLNLVDTDREYSKDRIAVFGAIQDYTGKRDTKSATDITANKKPTMALGRVFRHMLGNSHQSFMSDPRGFLTDLVYENQRLAEMVAEIPVVPVSPEYCAWGGVRVVALARHPQAFHQSDFAGYFEGCEFDGLMMQRRQDTDGVSLLPSLFADINN